MKTPIYRKGICIILLTIFSLLFTTSLYSAEEKKGLELSKWRPFAFLGKMGGGKTVDIKKFIHSYAKYSLWEFKVKYYARDYDRDRPYYSSAKGLFENRYPIFYFTYNMDYEYFYKRKLRIKDAYFYVAYTPRHEWKGNSYSYIGPYEEEQITVNGWIQWMINRKKYFYLTTGWDYSCTKQDQDPTGINFAGTTDWWFNPATQTWEYLPGVTARTAYPHYSTALGGYDYTSWDVYVGIGYHGTQY